MANVNNTLVICEQNQFMTEVFVTMFYHLKVMLNIVVYLQINLSFSKEYCKFYPNYILIVESYDFQDYLL